MYVATTSLPTALPPEAYSSPRQYEAEVGALLHSSWHVVGSWKQVSQDGDFITASLLDTPIQVRNFNGELRAFSNICAHRHCLLTNKIAGNSSSMSCQYHGWEYGADGRTRRIPCPKEFMPFDRERHRLVTYRVARCGQLIFVSLDENGPDLFEQLGDFAELCESRFNEDWSQTLSWDPNYDVNWKVPIENSLEAYHIPCVHPETFRQYPGPERSTHLLLPHRTGFGTRLPFDAHSRVDQWFQSGEGWLMRRLNIPATGDYWQHHVFPNLLFSFTDAISLCHCVIPTGPKSCRAVVRQFGRSGGDQPILRRWLARAWGCVTAGITKQILKEDMQLFGDVQRGLDHSPHVGLLGACEERIHAFQNYVASRCEQFVPPSNCDSSCNLSAEAVHRLETHL